ncbi:MAG: TetR family transcriptional regulator [Clostridia bacterium]|nr:TetR family transcriptional regulator [Clostridia bacterium]
MRKSDITRGKILKAAEKAFALRGFYGASVNDIADTAAVNKRMIYAHFENKESLYIAVIDEAFRRLAEAEDTLLKQNLDCVEAVEKIIEHYFKFFAKNKAFVKIIMRENINEGMFFKKTSTHFVKITSVELLKTKIKQGKENGTFKSCLDVEDAAFMIINLCFSCFSNAYLLGDIMQKSFAGEVQKMCAETKDICMRLLS